MRQPNRELTAGEALAIMKAVDSLMKEGSEFEAACAAVRLPPTRRQARKWLQGRGLALATHKKGMKES